MAERKREMRKQTIRLVDIAKETGFSANTVSLALSGSPRISEETRKIITEAAQKLNYIPNSIARSLVKKETHTIGIILRDLSSPILMSAAIIIEKELARRGYMLIMMSAKGDAVAEINALISQQVQGILVYPVWSERSIHNFIRLRNNNFPLVLMSSSGTSLPLDMVYVDQRVGGYRATEHLLKLGHRRIAIVSDNNQKMQGYRDALSDYHCAMDSSIVYPLRSHNYQNGFNAAEYLFTQCRGRFTAIFATTDQSAAGIMYYCLHNGIRIPEDVALVGYDNTDISSFLQVPLTTMSYHVEQEAIQAVDLLLHRIAENDFSQLPPIQIQLKPELVVRDSCGTHLSTSR